MKSLKNSNGGAKLYITIFVFLFVSVVSAIVFVKFYSYIFSKDISGEVMKVKRVTQVTGIISSAKNLDAKNLFSFAVAIKDHKTKEIFTSSTEDRKWAVVSEGLCVTAKFYPYPPWNLDKSGTYHNARLLRMRECETKKAKETKKLEASKEEEPKPEVKEEEAVQKGPEAADSEK